MKAIATSRRASGRERVRAKPPECRPHGWIRVADAFEQAYTPAEAEAKQTHKLTRQTCVLWVASEKGYVSYVSPETIRIVQHPALAVQLSEDEAEDLAQSVRERGGLQAAIRPYYAHSGV